MNIRAVVPLAISLLTAVVLLACVGDGDDPTLTPASTTEPSESPSATASASATATATAEVTATPGGPVIATIRASEWQVWPDVVFTDQPLETLKVGDQVEVDQRRFHWVRLVRGGWMPTDSTSVGLSAPFESLPEFETPRHPPGTLTGLPAVDAVIEAALAADGAALAELAVFHEVECKRGVGDTGDFFCPDGVETGTVVEVFSFVGCHGNPMTREETVTAIDRWARDELGLYAVYEQVTGIAILMTADGAAFTLSLNSDRMLEYVSFGCGLTPPELAVTDVTDFILAPPER